MKSLYQGFYPILFYENYILSNSFILNSIWYANLGDQASLTINNKINKRK